MYQLFKIVEGEDMPENHEGNPAAYWGNWVQAGEGHKCLSKSDVGLSYASGHAACEYTTDAEITESKETSYGVHFGLTLQTGSDYAVGDAWAGAYTNVDYSSTTGESTSSIDTTSSGGQVQNIDMDALKDAGYREALIKQYHFKWQFGKWTRQLMQDGADVPFYGYVLSEVRMPASGLILELDYLYEKGDLKVSLPANSFEHTGSAIEPKPVIRFDDKTLKEGRDYTLSYANNIDQGIGSVMITGTGKYGGNVAVEFTIETTTGEQDTEAEKTALREKEAEPTVSVRDAVNDSNNTYKVTSVNKKTVVFTKAKNVKSVTVPASIKINGEVYKVTEIGAKAFKGKKIRSVTIGKNVKKIKAKAFDGSKVTTVTLKTKLLKKAGVKGSLKRSAVKTVKVKVGSKSQNKTFITKYKKIFTKANAGKKVTVK